MSCPKCNSIYFDWWIDEEESPFTKWNCSDCQYSASEDESEIRICKVCGHKTEAKLRDQDGQYWWCLRCNMLKQL